MRIVSHSIEILNLSYSFTENKTVFQNVTFHISKGDRVALCGPNGAGKTTFLKVISQLLQPSSGQIRILGESSSKKIKHYISWVPSSELGFYSRLSGLENLTYFATLDGFSKSEINQKISRWSSQLNLEECLKTQYYLCSNGMKQSLALARALIRDTEILILDEPFRSLDAGASSRLMECLKNLPCEKTILFSTHSEFEALQLANRTFYFSQSSILEKNRVKEGPLVAAAL